MSVICWGYHLSINASGANPEAIRNKTLIERFTDQLVNDINMVPYGRPQVVDFGTGDKAGFTLVQLIETSNICAHFVNAKNEIYLDVFSCKDFDQNVVVKLMQQYFGVTSWTKNFFDRQAPVNHITL